MDEHGAAALAVGLRGYGIDVTTTPEAGLLEASDQEQLAYAAANARVVVTHDEDFLVLNASGISHAGIVYCHQDKYSLGDLLRMLVLVWEVYEPTRAADK